MSPDALTEMNAALEWDAATMPMPGENVLGDRAVVAFTERQTLLAVIDGVGHGADAAAAAQVAAHTLEHSAEQNIEAAALECHRALADTRGAAVSLASIDRREHTMSWLGIGNVECRLLHGGALPVTDSLLLHGGIVGHDLPRLTVQTTKIARGDVLIFATDGIRREYADVLIPSGSCRELAERILHEYLLGTDDALVLVARYLARA